MIIPSKETFENYKTGAANYHSETGNTRGVVDRCHAATGGDRIEVEDLQHYSRISKYLVGAGRAAKGLADPIEPPEIDVSGCDLLVIGSPVWSGKPTPAINAAIQALKGCEGKNSILFVTCGGSAKGCSHPDEDGPGRERRERHGQCGVYPERSPPRGEGEGPHRTDPGCRIRIG